MKQIIGSKKGYVIGSTIMPSEIILTPTTSGSFSYRVTWTPSYYNTSRYMIIVYPPESYTQEDLIIHNTDNSTVHNITIALNDCPHRIYSTFIPSKNVWEHLRITLTLEIHWTTLDIEMHTGPSQRQTSIYS